MTTTRVRKVTPVELSSSEEEEGLREKVAALENKLRRGNLQYFRKELKGQIERSRKKSADFQRWANLERKKHFNLLVKERRLETFKKELEEEIDYQPLQNANDTLECLRKDLVGKLENSIPKVSQEKYSIRSTSLPRKEGGGTLNAKELHDVLKEITEAIQNFNKACSDCYNSVSSNVRPGCLSCHSPFENDISQYGSTKTVKPYFCCSNTHYCTACVDKMRNEPNQKCLTCGKIYDFGSGETEAIRESENFRNNMVFHQNNMGGQFLPF
jgi:hypothetical protein